LALLSLLAVRHEGESLGQVGAGGIALRFINREGTIEDWNDPEEVVTHQVHGLPDLAQEREEVYEFLHDSSMRWVQLARPAGVRIDAVRHMPASFLSAISDDLKAEAGPEFVVLGEMFEGDPVKLAETAEVGGFSHIFDFPLHYAMVDVFCKDAPVGRLASVLSADRHYTDPDGLVTFLDNHDLPRVTSACGGDLERVKAALTFQLTTRGTPSITYGTEIALEGAEEPHNRADMDFAAARTLAETIREVLALRSAHPSLTRGTIHLSHLDDDLMVYQRWTEAEGAVIAVNSGETARTVALPAHWMGESMSTYGATATRDQRGFVVEPGAVGVALVDSPRPTALLMNHARVTLQVVGVEVPEGGSLRMVGPDLSLGNWDPMRAPEIPTESFEIDWPRHEVLEVKLVLVDAEGEVTWQEGVNTYALIDGDQSIVLNW